jgi:hypothetical protein
MKGYVFEFANSNNKVGKVILFGEEELNHHHNYVKTHNYKTVSITEFAPSEQMIKNHECVMHKLDIYDRTGNFYGFQD